MNKIHTLSPQRTRIPYVRSTSEYPFRTQRKIKKDEEYGEHTLRAGAKVNADANFLLSELFLFLYFLRVLCVLCGARVFFDLFRHG